MNFLTRSVKIQTKLLLCMLMILMFLLNLPQNIDWEVVSPVNVFEFNSSSGGSVQLSFKQDAIPDYEMVNERDWNVTIKVWENEKAYRISS